MATNGILRSFATGQSSLVGRVNELGLGIVLALGFVGVIVSVGKLLGSDYGHGEFRFRVRLRVKLGLGLQFNNNLNTKPKRLTLILTFKCNTPNQMTVHWTPSKIHNLQTDHRGLPGRQSHNFFYNYSVVSSPLDCSSCALDFTPGRPVLSDTNWTSLRSISSHAAITHED